MGDSVENSSSEEIEYSYASSKPITDRCLKINKKNGNNKTLDSENYINKNCYNSKLKNLTVCDAQFVTHNKLGNFSHCKSNTRSHKESSQKCKIFFSNMVRPKSLIFASDKNDKKTGSIGNDNYQNWKTLSFKSKNAVPKCITYNEQTESNSNKENISSLACRKAKCQPAKYSKHSLFMKKKVSPKPRHSPKANHTNHIQNDSKPQCNTMLDYKSHHRIELPKETDQSGNSKNKCLSPKLSNNKSFDKNTRIQYQLANKLMPVSKSEELIFCRKITVKPHSSYVIMKYHQNNCHSNCQSLKEMSCNKDPPNHYKHNLLCKRPPERYARSKGNESKTFCCKSPENSSSSLCTLISSESYASLDDSASPLPKITNVNIQQFLHPHWRRVPHKSYFGWTEKHESLYSELQIKVQEDKIPSAYYRSLEEYIEDTRRISKKTNFKCLKGPVVVDVADILDLIHKNHALSLKNCKPSQAKLFKLDAYDADSDEIDD